LGKNPKAPTRENLCEQDGPNKLKEPIEEKTRNEEKKKYFQDDIQAGGCCPSMGKKGGNRLGEEKKGAVKKKEVPPPAKVQVLQVFLSQKEGQKPCKKKKKGKIFPSKGGE